jgi:ABC-2 type transport system permease protein/lipopolysaccharide transport system permease protein
MRYRHYIRLWSALKDLWGRRELVWALAERDLRARYKQSNFGFAWAFITPVLLMIVFSLFLKRVAHIQTGGVPYPLFSYIGLLPWGLFQSSISNGSQSLIGNIPILKKVACPREVFPLATIVIATVDMLVATTALGILFLIYGFAPKGTSSWVPLILAVQFSFTIGITLIVSSATVYIRDLKQAVPLILQLGLFATPVAYGLDAVPSSIRSIYGYINPLAPVIDGYRRTVLNGQAPDWPTFIPAMATGVVVLLVGYLLFKKFETGIADVA